MSRSPIKEVVVVGGGIGGLTTALALRRAGISARVYERASRLRDIQAGGGLVLWHNAIPALRGIGMEEPVQKIGHELRRYRFRSWRDRDLADWSIERMAGRLGAPAYTVSRAELHRTLSAEVGDDLVLGARCAGFDSDADGVTVRFEDGREERGDLLVGADGLRSAVRGAMMPYEPPPRYAGVTAWQGIAHVPGLGTPGHTFVSTFGRGRWFVYYPLTDGHVYWDAIISDRISRRMDAFGQTWREIVTREFAGWPVPVAELVEATPMGGVSPIDIFDRDPVTRWSTDRATLVGDAAHPMTFNLGQGANQAIEGAVVLASCLAGARDVPGALAEYERRRVARTAKVVRRSRANGAFSRWSAPAACWFRDAFMRLTFDRLVYRKTYELTMDTGLSH
ncbi:FAD-dependent monooxygenase [Planomonospora venezuelensis]|uniref:2-polyprenyl-6-methoxyphenol hydroxylase-like FAD-dependent oxidoreductase n=1 Tax=Planomonospora venezuelensis TaxID=1999 RepID=A0A841CWX5_PLAVE|nr:2-polyprenyl-6-methoxyphenol hydroxylase-like FAD-dependent oxidoreductase [Planomonospora venezuelensis]GIN00803.1 FAD-dependent monooxygenase [Planomonospora venezuelensis]